jgi:hypothetical protein
MVFTAKKKSKNRVADPTKNNPYLSQKLRKREAIVPVLSPKIVVYLFIPSVFFENPWRSPA